MRQPATTRTPTRRTLGPTAVGLIVVTAAIVGTLVYRSASASTPSLGQAHAPDAHRALSRSAPTLAPPLVEVRGGDHRGPATEDGDGVLPDGATVFDDGYPGISNLDADLLQALRDAATDAADDGIELDVNSGWRSRAYQGRLLREAVSKYGSDEEAARWVATAGHVPTRVGRRGRHRVARSNDVALRAWRRVRAVPGLPQRALALRTAPQGDRSRLPDLCTPTPRMIRGCNADERDRR